MWRTGCLHLISNGMSCLRLSTFSLSPQHQSSYPSTRTHLLIATKTDIKMERIIYQKAPIPPPICSRRLSIALPLLPPPYIFSCSALTSHFIVYCIFGGEKVFSFSLSVGKLQRPAFHTHGGSCGLIYPFALCSIQWDFSKSLSWSVKGISLTLMCASGTLLAQDWA